MSTPHNAAPKSSIAKYVIVTGDPLRCKKFAETFLNPWKLLSSVRNCYCYTGIYKGIEITIMSHGMGHGSIGIYTYELFAPEIYDADLIIRCGSSGGMNDKVKTGDVVVVENIRTNSNYGEWLNMPHNKEDTIKVDSELVSLAHKCARELNIPLIGTTNWSTDNFYTPYNLREQGERSKCDTVEMESYVLDTNAKYHNKKGLTILTVTDCMNKDGSFSSLTWQEREQTLSNMFLVGLEVLVQYSKMNKV
ncbi:Purine nucleoside phosphorylase [Mycoplasma wenyonii str. Massachusetts]|uniref:Uridine phosphorylase n=1 Tax=Mycoplasma wenyonii (strain Massachusetts) TaxID=1197325 RepID=I6YA91_MYCWM|nr:purine-nucleoside phosphorylase [Mycoplasma wenyonii]AFN64861.1 Purine nucleoside phosphorylase [Mycoplasma wenyonii str. Massachusetts]